MALVALLYFGTMARWVGAGDTALLLEQMHTGRLSSHVNSHNLTIVLGWLALKVPLGSLAVRGHVLSVLAGLSMVFAFHEIAWRRLQRPAPVVAITLAVAVTHTVWWHATIVENYCFNGLFLYAVVLLLLWDY
jgi:predicted RND superfamily exporter protein